MCYGFVLLLVCYTDLSEAFGAAQTHPHPVFHPAEGLAKDVPVRK